MWHKCLFWAYFFVCFVWFDSLRPINNLSVKQGRVFLDEPVLSLGQMWLAQGPKRSDAGEARTRGPSVFGRIALDVWLHHDLGHTRTLIYYYRVSLYESHKCSEVYNILHLSVSFPRNTRRFNLADFVWHHIIAIVWKELTFHNIRLVQLYWNYKVVSAWRLCLPVPNVWTHFIQIFTLQTLII